MQVTTRSLAVPLLSVIQNVFGANATANLASRDYFIASMQANKTGYCVGGHDHMHHRSIVADSTGASKVEQIIGSSNSYKFYIPKSTPNDTTGRESVIAQELFTVGYYIFTVDGPSVTVDFYSSSHGADYGDIDLSATPSFAFYKRERFGYSLNGQQFVIANNGSYTGVQDAFQGTTAKILSGTNEDLSNDSDYNNRESVKTVKTGWREMPSGAASAVLKLWGLANNLELWNASLTGLQPSADAESSSSWPMARTGIRARGSCSSAEVSPACASRASAFPPRSATSSQ